MNIYFYTVENKDSHSSPCRDLVPGDTSYNLSDTALLEHKTL